MSLYQPQDSSTRTVSDTITDANPDHPTQFATMDTLTLYRLNSHYGDLWTAVQDVLCRRTIMELVEHIGSDQQLIVYIEARQGELRAELDRRHGAAR